MVTAISFVMDVPCLLLFHHYILGAGLNKGRVLSALVTRQHACGRGYIPSSSASTRTLGNFENRNWKQLV